MAIGVNWAEIWKPVWKAVWQTVYVPPPPPAPQRGAGKSRKKRRYTVEIDGESFPVESPQDAEALLLEVRKLAQERADKAVTKAAKAPKRNPRKVWQDAKSTLVEPSIKADYGDIAAQMLGEVRSIYQDAMRDIEIATLMARRQAEIEEDDEDVLLLL